MPLCSQYRLNFCPHRARTIAVADTAWTSAAALLEGDRDRIPRNDVAGRCADAAGLPICRFVGAEFRQRGRPRLANRGHDCQRRPVACRALHDGAGQQSVRPYLSRDCTGVEIGGAVKNVLAIACGIVIGRGLGDNARAALITRGLAEMVRLGVALGAEAETFRGLSGLGDMVLTCTGGQSRNHALGLALGRGENLEVLLAARRTIEGVATASAIVELAARADVEMPICAAVDAVLHHGASIDETTDRLLRRPYRRE